MLHKLPPEILDMVAQSLADKQDLRALALVSRTVHRGVQRTLWSSLDLWPIHEAELWHFNWKPVFKKALPAFVYATELNFKSTFLSQQGERCPHWRDQEGPADSIVRDHRFRCLADAVESIVDNIPRHRLRKFTWGLGTCVPERLLGRRGILARTQPQLSCLDLTTAGDCLIWDEIDLSPFRRLKDFRWIGPRVDDFDAITDVLQTNREHLTTLELDFVDWDKLRDQMNYEPEIDPIEGIMADNFFHKNILSINPSTILEKPLFPALVSLSLSSIPLLGRTARAFDFTALQSLTIRKCPHWDRFLAEIPKLGVPLRLKSLEIHQQYEPQAATSTTAMTPEHQALLRVISSFTGLEELFLSLVAPIDALALWNTVVKQHGSTLKRFIHHLCAPTDNGVAVASNNSIGTPASTVIPEIYDIPDFDLAPKLGEFSKQNPLRNIYRPESIGLSCIPEVLGPMFSSFAKGHTNTSSLKLIHIRQSRRFDSRGGSWATTDMSYPILMLPTLYDDGFQTTARYPISLSDSIYGRNFVSNTLTRAGLKQQNSDGHQHEEGGGDSIEWEKEAEEIAELARQGWDDEEDDNSSRSSRSSGTRHSSPSLNSPPSSPSSANSDEAAEPHRSQDHTMRHTQTPPRPNRYGLRDPLIRFANWAFGPHGISSLEVIAFGDFGHGRWEANGRENVLLVRNRKKPRATTTTTGIHADGKEQGQILDDEQEERFSIVWPFDKEYGARADSVWPGGTTSTAFELVERNRHFLQACPMEPLVDYDQTWSPDYYQ